MGCFAYSDEVKKEGGTVKISLRLNQGGMRSLMDLLRGKLGSLAWPEETPKVETPEKRGKKRSRPQKGGRA